MIYIFYFEFRISVTTSEIWAQPCLDILPYTQAQYPNAFVNSPLQAIGIYTYIATDLDCPRQDATLLWCGTLFAEGDDDARLPCRQLCEEVQSSCPLTDELWQDLINAGLEYNLDCSVLPDEEDGECLASLDGRRKLLEGRKLIINTPSSVFSAVPRCVKP